ncbi:3882_t:CDS:1, partial [Gigaspora rosea]
TLFPNSNNWLNIFFSVSVVVGRDHFKELVTEDVDACCDTKVSCSTISS